MTDTNSKLRITDWAVEDRPREKMLLKGISALSDAELLAILIGSGNRNETAVELSQRILCSVNNNLNSLGKLSIKDFTKQFKGIGDAKAISIVAALELGKRRKSTQPEQVPQITSSREVFEIFYPLLSDLRHEECWILLLNRSNKVIKQSQIGRGGIIEAVVDIRLIVKEALENMATGIVLAHNHPSGNICPSGEDNNITLRLREACHLLDILLVDHIIICEGEYYSYKDNEKL